MAELPRHHRSKDGAITEIPRDQYRHTAGHWHWYWEEYSRRMNIVLRPPSPNPTGPTWDCVCDKPLTHALDSTATGAFYCGDPLFIHREW